MTMRSPASALRKRAYDAEKIGAIQQSEFFNRIGQERRFTAVRGTSALLPIAAGIADIRFDASRRSLQTPIRLLIRRLW
jgi:hypothetical protein